MDRIFDGTERLRKGSGKSAAAAVRALAAVLPLVVFNTDDDNVVLLIQSQCRLILHS